MNRPREQLQLVLEPGAATFDATQLYRYVLRRTFETGSGRCTFIMLNPSTADSERNDPTVRRCLAFARRLDAHELVVVNLFGLRSTNPARLYDVADPIGPDNDAAILEAARGAERVICAWGNHGKHKTRALGVVSMLQAADVRLWCLGTTRAGHPRHPLYVPGNVEIRRYEPRAR